MQERRTACTVAFLCLGVLLVAAPRATASEASGAIVRVEYTHPTVTLRVTEPASLQAVLEGLCQETAARCDIAASAEDLAVSPLTLVGSWAHVVAKLLEGTGLNYVAFPPAPGRPGRLLVETREAGGLVGTSGQAGLASDGRSSNHSATSSPRVGLTDEEIRALRARQLAEDPVEPPPPPDKRPGLTDEEIRQLRAAQPPYSPPALAPLPRGAAVAGMDSARTKVVLGRPSPPAGLTPEQQAQEDAFWGMFTGGVPRNDAAGPSQPPRVDMFGNPVQAPQNDPRVTGYFVLPFSDANGNPIVVRIQNPGQAHPPASPF